MTKIYIADDTYEVYLASGKTMVLTAADMNEIAEESPMVEADKQENEDYKVLFEQAQKIAESLRGDLDELESTLMCEDFDVYMAVRGDIADLRKKIGDI